MNVQTTTATLHPASSWADSAANAPTAKARVQRADQVELASGSTPLQQIGGASLGAVASSNEVAALASGMAKLQLGVTALNSGVGLNDAMSMLLADQAQQDAREGARLEGSIRNKMENLSELNKKEIEKLTQRAQELGQANKENGCIKVLSFVVDVVKAAVAAVQGNYAAAAATIAATILKAVGLEKVGQGLSLAADVLSVTSSAIGAIAKNAAGTAAKTATKAAVDTVKTVGKGAVKGAAEAAVGTVSTVANHANQAARAQHAANADMIMADVKDIAAMREDTQQRADDDMEALKHVVESAPQTMSLFQKELDARLHGELMVNQQLTV